MRSGQGFERSAALDHDAPPRGLGYAGNERHRCREDERARRCRNEHGKAANEVAGNQPRNRRHGNRDGQKDDRVAVGKPHERRLCRLRRRYQAENAGVGAGAGIRRSDHFEGVAGIERSAIDRRALAFCHRDGFTGQRGFVDRRRRGTDDPIDRNDFSALDKKFVGNRDVGDRNILDAVIEPSMRDARRTIDKRAQIALGARHARNPRARCRPNTSARRRRRRAVDQVQVRPPSTAAQWRPRRRAR